MPPEQRAGLTITSDMSGIKGTFVRISRPLPEGIIGLDAYFLNLGLKNGDTIEYGTSRSPDDFLVVSVNRKSSEFDSRTATTSEAAALVFGVNTARKRNSLTLNEATARDLLRQRLAYLVESAMGEVGDMYKRELELILT